jgi:hypothetical protein
MGTPSDADGRVVLPHLRPGILLLVIDSRELCPPPLQVLVPSGGELDVGDVALQPPARVAVIAEGLGEGGSIQARWLESVPLHCQVRPSYLGDRPDTGERQIHPGRYRIVARDRTQFAEIEIDTRALTAEPVRLQLRPAPVLRLVNRAGDDFVQLVLRDAQGRVLYQNVLTGKWEIDWPLPGGDYVAEVKDLAGKVTTKRVQLGPGGATLLVP